MMAEAALLPSFSHLIRVDADDGDHARRLGICGRLHALPSQLHQPQAVLKPERAAAAGRDQYVWGGQTFLMSE